MPLIGAVSAASAEIFNDSGILYMEYLLMNVYGRLVGVISVIIF
jgi:hypothetical protein